MSHTEGIQSNQFEIVIYDGDCPFCVAGIQFVRHLGLLKKFKAVPWREFEGNDFELAEQIKTEFALYNLTSKKRIGGPKAFIRLLSSYSYYYPFAVLIGLPGIFHVLLFLYNLFALNRRVISPPKYSGPIACDCDPPFNLNYRLALYVVLLSIALGGSVLVGMSIGFLHPEQPFWITGLQLALSVESGWLLNFLVFPFFLRNLYWKFVEQCLVVMTIGILFLLPIAVFVRMGKSCGLSLDILFWIVIIGVILSNFIMFISQYRRAKALQFPKWVPWFWLILLEIGEVPFFIAFRFFK